MSLQGDIRPDYLLRTDGFSLSCPRESVHKSLGKVRLGAAPTSNWGSLFDTSLVVHTISNMTQELSLMNIHEVTLACNIHSWTTELQEGFDLPDIVSIGLGL